MNALLKATLNAIPDMLWLKDPAGVYLACNPAFERFFGVPEAQIVGRTDADFCSPEDAALFRAHDLRALQAGAPTRNEEWITLADGDARILLETTKTPMRDDQGTLIGVLGVGRDITARWEAQQQLVAQQERFRALSEASFESIFIFHQRVKTTGFQPVSFSCENEEAGGVRWTTDTAVTRYFRSSITLCG